MAQETWYKAFYSFHLAYETQYAIAQTMWTLKCPEPKQIIWKDLKNTVMVEATKF